MSEASRSLSAEHHAAVPFWRDVRILRWIFQLVVLALVVLGVYTLATNLTTNLEAVGLNTSFEFVQRRAGFTISEGGFLDVQRYAVLVPADSGVTGTDDLAGLNVAVAGETATAFLEAELDEAGIAANVESVNQAERAITGVVQGDTDALVGRRRNLQSAVDQALGEEADSVRISSIGFKLESVKPFDTDSTMLAAYSAGVLNTIRAVVVGIVLATILGIIVGVARLSDNWLISRLALGYIEVMQNTPLLVQLFFWFELVKALPPQRIDEIFSVPGQTFKVGPIEIPPIAYLSQRATAIPGIERLDSWSGWWPFLVVGVVAAVVAWRVRVTLRERQSRPPTGQFWWAVIAFVAVLAIGWLIVPGQPIRLVIPKLEGDPIAQYQGGAILTNSFQAVLLGLVLYTAAFIAEVVRSGIQAVDYGQIEAAIAIGLKPGQRLRLVILPQAMRVAIPPLINQYLNLTKNSSLAIAVGYPDLFNTSQTVGNQTGQNVQVIAMVMGTYLSFSLLISLVLNYVNKKMQLVER